ncbi:hypothetical protein BABINDRAFT_41525 [Babjeviella inositovora NRRL Y-12698]|uniref:phosphoinositide 5-phosphatase n=1 Tax=Babjeviella inositovora NRRL Y-12698 TaxID=984486 RepID=A0A1E3QIW1_9ASCO|nr:uncharacterized protein BABINDRAFT_41525 [Babjeviella inositovora NRRL Y-12698]ODQ77548.1 hypothetical protein BABINDRAFT_41525 [Babjeviella inositovora NRRL Y-12698]
MKLYLKEKPRTLALVANDYALIFVCPPPPPLTSREKHKLAKTFSKPKPRCLIEFVPVSSLPLQDFKDITGARSGATSITGFLGLLPLKNHIFLGFVTKKAHAGSINPTQTINVINEVEFLCLDSSQWDHISQYPKDANAPDTSHYPCQAVTKLLSSGSFYYSLQFDITSNYQERGMNTEFKIIADGNDYFRRFMWNRFMVDQLISYRSRLSSTEREIFDASGFLVIITRGFVQTASISDVGNSAGLLTLISKQSCMKQGALYGPHGMDEMGNCAGFVETEVIYHLKEHCFSYVVVQGDYPLIHELASPKTVMGSGGATFPRPPEVVQHAFNSHLDLLQSQYGEIHVLNVSGTSKKTVQQDLSAQYRRSALAFKRTSPIPVSYTDLDLLRRLISKCTSSMLEKRIVDQFDKSIVDFGAFFYDATKEAYIGKQLGVFRINCHDSEKVHLVEHAIAKTVFELALRDLSINVSYSPGSLASSVWRVLEKIWASNAAELYRISTNYMVPSSDGRSAKGAAPQAHKAGIVGTMAKKYLLNPVTDHSLKTRHYFVVEKLLGRLNDQYEVTLHDPIHDYVTSELEKREKLFISRKEIGVFVGSFNVNAAQPEENLSGWLFPESSGFDSGKFDTAADIYALGFQEIVELKPGKMLNTDASNRNFWKKKIQTTLNSQFRDGKKYVLLWDGQLGGILLLLFVKSTRIDRITNIEGRVRKTGFGGMSANKGGVGVSFKFSGTNFCFISSHLAAGLNNVEERHVDYKSLARGLKFSRNKRIKDHDVVMWFGDLNYRILLGSEEVKPMVKQARYGELFEHDQLGLQMTAGESFPYFNEAEIKFAPTYKFDKGTGNYDTSEKGRVPAWCDRIVTLTRNGNELQQLSYNSVPEICFSDHKPIYGGFKAQVKVIDHTVKQELAKQLYEQRRLEVAKTTLDALYFNKQLNELTTLPVSGLPPPSSDSRKWWLEGGMFAKVCLVDGPTDDLVLNPELSINPFDVEGGAEQPPVFISRNEWKEAYVEKGVCL